MWIDTNITRLLNGLYAGQHEFDPNMQKNMSGSCWVRGSCQILPRSRLRDDDRNLPVLYQLKGEESFYHPRMPEIGSLLLCVSHCGQK